MKNILLFPSSKLREKSKSIIKVSKDDILISKKMIEIMKRASGMGLAANQIGILKKIITINYYDSKKEKENIYTLYNPVIKSYSKDTIKMEEGCLSVPEQFAEIERPSSIELEYLDEKNNLINKKKKGLEARILQHEIDHLDGKLFFDYLSSLKRNIMIKRLKKIKKKDKINE